MSESTRFHSAEELAVTLTGEQNRFVLSAFADGADIENAEYFDNYDLPAPIRIC